MPIGAAFRRPPLRIAHHTRVCFQSRSAAGSSGFGCISRHFSASLVGLSQRKITRKCSQRHRNCSAAILETRSNWRAAKRRPYKGFCYSFYTKSLPRHVQMRSVFFVLATRSGGRRCRSIVDRSKVGNPEGFPSPAESQTADGRTEDPNAAPSVKPGRKRRPQKCMDQMQFSITYICNSCVCHGRINNNTTP